VLYYRRALTDVELGRNYKTLKASLEPRGIVLP